jgi:hypothetical protein
MPRLDNIKDCMCYAHVSGIQVIYNPLTPINYLQLVSSKTPHFMRKGKRWGWQDRDVKITWRYRLRCLGADSWNRLCPSVSRTGAPLLGYMSNVKEHLNTTLRTGAAKSSWSWVCGPSRRHPYQRILFNIRQVSTLTIWHYGIPQETYTTSLQALHRALRKRYKFADRIY